MAFRHPTLDTELTFAQKFPPTCRNSKMPLLAGAALAAIKFAGPVLGPATVVIGFGPLGPIAGGLAAAAQGAIYGAAVPAGGVFAVLQAIGMAV
ncbi:hypothetical protein HII31_04784 [Pseudocercospora fuligena]|uniref:Uncharacterized protein n=1 Tax=Pseudocercospora fuligena TaxID=685502 RepID=A0A8H6RMS1_9PEZI|nr:hypothetical protein HII31_04784 [Pseudocercospora fuligena]